MATKITAPNGRYSIIARSDSAFAKEHAGSISIQSSTELQPWVAVNFAADGSAAGGRTMQESLRTAMIEKSRAANMIVEEI
jgi:hypothetical protein